MAAENLTLLAIENLTLWDPRRGGSGANGSRLGGSAAGCRGRSPSRRPRTHGPPHDVSSGWRSLTPGTILVQQGGRRSLPILKEGSRILGWGDGMRSVCSQASATPISGVPREGPIRNWPNNWGLLMDVPSRRSPIPGTRPAALVPGLRARSGNLPPTRARRAVRTRSRGRQ